MTWQHNCKPDIPEFDPQPAPVILQPPRVERLRAYHREYNRRWYQTPTAKWYRRRYHETHYVAHPRREMQPSPQEVAEIEQRIEAMRLLKERGMVLRGKENPPCSG